MSTAAVAAPPAEAPPPPRHAIERPRLTKALRTAQAACIAVIAPAGYGKTVLLSQWAEEDPRDVLWLTLGARDDDPIRLIGRIAAALDAREPIGDEVLAPLRGPSPDAAAAAVPRLCEAIGGRAEPMILVIDDAHVLRERSSLDAVAVLAERFPAGSQLVIAARSEPDVGIGRLRAHGRLDEIRADALTMTRSEAAALFAASGLALSKGQTLRLLELTEGWSAGLYLAARGMRSGEEPDAYIARFAGDEREIADYLRDEFLSSLDESDHEFLIRASVLDGLTGDLCDAVLDRTGSAEDLRRLSRSNLLLAPLDTKDVKFRMHALLRETLLAELQRVAVAERRRLQVRASDWYWERGDPDRAVEHAIASGDLALAGARIWQLAPDYNSVGRRATMHGWIAAFSDEQVAREPALALAGAVAALTDGDGAAMMRHYTAAAERLDRDDAADPGLLIGREIVRLTGDDRVDLAAVAAGLGPLHGRLPERSVWRPYCRLAGGIATYLSGDRDRARALLEEGANPAIPAPSPQSLCHAVLALIALDQDRHDDAEQAVTESLARIELYAIADYQGSSLPFAAAALVRAGRGDRTAAATLAIADELIDKSLAVNGWFSPLVRVTMARAHLALGDAEVARQLLQEANVLRESHPEAVVLTEWLDAARETLDAGAGPGERWPLTPAERRLLHLLPTHLTFPEIADRLIVSTNTVKTQARSIYRKFGVSSRSEAVECARLAGLIAR